MIDGFEGGCRLYTAAADGSAVATELCKEGWDAGYRGEYEMLVDMLFIDACRYVIYTCL